MTRQPKSIDATIRSWKAAQSRLTPVIGENGFRSLFARSLHLTRREHPWLPGLSATDNPFADLQASLEGETQERTQEASRALLATFTGLLRLLIGEALTSCLLDPVPHAMNRR
jgi:hypothetical protein